MTLYRKCQEIGRLDYCTQEQIIEHGRQANFIKTGFVQYQYMPDNILNNKTVKTRTKIRCKNKLGVYNVLHNLTELLKINIDS